jgi:hypothetical protein
MSPSRAPRAERVAFYTPDLSTFCKNLLAHLSAVGAHPPSHLALLNLIAKSAGHRNFQMLRAEPARAAGGESATVAPVPLVLPREANVPASLRELIACFDTEGRLMRWPNRYAAQQIAIWALWSRLPAKREMSEAAVNRWLEAAHTFGDPATLRRELVNARLLWRTIDGRVYKKLPARPDATAREFLDTLFAHARMRA